MPATFSDLIRRRPGEILLLICVLAAVFTFDRYGLGWDEPAQRKTGIINYRYIFQQDQALLDYVDRDYGIAVELPLILMERALGLDDTREIYMARHLATHLFFLLGAYAGYCLAFFLYRNRLLALLAFLFLIIHPRIYGHSFFNSKDIPFMSMFLITLLASARAFGRKTVWRFIVLGICTGLLANIRIMGLMVPVLVLAFLFMDMIREKAAVRHLRFMVAFILPAFAILFATWPYLWSNPVVHIGTAFRTMSNYRWVSEVLFSGELILSSALPWCYAPAWILISTPEMIIAAGLAGTIALLARLVRTPFKMLAPGPERNNIFFLVVCYGSLASVIILGSVLYDGWRQLYFIYPSFVMLGIYGLHLLEGNWRKAMIGVCIAACIPVMIYSVRNYPHQHVYFNHFVPSWKPGYLRQHYDLDYWGVSYRDAYEWLLEKNSADTLKVHVAVDAGTYNLKILEPRDRGRIRLSSMEEADFFISNYRWHPGDYPAHYGREVYSVTAGRNRICSIFYLR